MFHWHTVFPLCLVTIWDSSSTFFCPVGALIDSQVAAFSGSKRPHSSPGAHTVNSPALSETILQEAPHNARGTSQCMVPIDNEGGLKQQSMRDSRSGRLGSCRRLGWGFNRRPRAIIPECRQPETQSGRRGGGVDRWMKWKTIYSNKLFWRSVSDLLSISGHNLVFGGVFSVTEKKKQPTKQQIQMFPAAAMGSRIFNVSLWGFLQMRGDRDDFVLFFTMEQLLKVSVFSPTSRQCSIPQAYLLQACNATEGMDGLMGTDQGAQGVRGAPT